VPGMAGTTDDGALGRPRSRRSSSSPAEIALAFKDAYRLLQRPIAIFTALPVRSLDRLSLQNKLREIGRMEGSTAKAFLMSSPAQRIFSEWLGTACACRRGRLRHHGTETCGR
jgi:hypothetical protein